MKGSVSFRTPPSDSENSGCNQSLEALSTYQEPLQGRWRTPSLAPWTLNAPGVHCSAFLCRPFVLLLFLPWLFISHLTNTY